LSGDDVIDAEKSEISDVSQDSDEILVDFGKWFRKKKVPRADSTSGSDTAFVNDEGQHSTRILQAETQQESQIHSAHREVHKQKDLVKNKPDSADEEAISFDKIKSAVIGLFNRKTVKSHSNAGSKDDVDFDWKAHSKWIIPTVLIIAVFIFAFYARAQTVNLPATDQWAQDSVFRFYRNQFEGEINQQFPNLPSENKAALIDKDFQAFLDENKELVAQQIEQTSKQFKEGFRDDTGQTYLLGIDPYYYFRQSRNLLEYGNIGTEIRDGLPFDTYKPAVEGSYVENNFHPYVGVALFKIMGVFTNISLMGAFFYVGALIAALSIIPAFFICRRVGGNVAGFFGSMFTAINLFFVSRTAGESSDTDAYNVFFPLLISWVFIESLYQKDLKKRIILMSLVGFLIGLYAFTWTGWWFMWYFAAVTLGARILYAIVAASLKEKKMVILTQKIKDNLIQLGVFIVSTTIFISLFVGVDHVIKLYKRPFQFLALKEVASSKIWPNVLTTVAELNAASPESVVAQLGGYFIITISVVGILYSLKRKLNWLDFASFTFLGVGIGMGLQAVNRDTTGLLVFALLLVVLGIAGIVFSFRDGFQEWDITYFVLFGMWLAITLWSTSRGVRFTLLIVPALVLGIGFFAGIVYRQFVYFISDGLHVPKAVTKIVLVLLLLLLFVYPNNHIRDGYAQGLRSVPSMNDGWYNALTSIKDNSQSDAIVTSWWDFGHWFKAIADRPVTFDGGSQNRPQAHWVGKLLLTPDERVSFGILRMLDCGANWGFDAIDERIQDTVQSVDIVNEIVVEDRAGAAAVLERYGFTAFEIENVLQHTHCTPPEGFVIASDDMVGKSGVWGHFGAWDFTKAAMVFGTKDLSREESLLLLENQFGLSAEEAQQTYTEIITEDPNQWIAPWPGYAGTLQACQSNDDAIICALNGGGGQFILEVDRATWNATIPTNNGVVYPNTLIYPENGVLKERVFDGDRIGLSVSLVPQGDGFAAFLSDPLQARSMFSQMFFYEGFGLQCFDLLTHERQVTGGSVYVYQVDWDCYEGVKDSF
jgi:dolichyl-phosphooligosaccharide-protein glycotransferase